MFTDNKYSKIYFSIIQQAQARQLLDDIYTEKHHIIPRSLKGTNDPNNLVKLTAREHYICHLLLTKMTTGDNKIKMVYAAWRMMCRQKDSKRDYKIISRTYQRIKEERANYLKTLVGEKNHNFGKKTGRTSNHFTEEWRENLSKSKKGKSTWNKGIARTNEEKAKMSATRKLRSKDPNWNIRPPCSEETANKIANALKGKKWANNGNERKYVSPNDFELLITSGWVAGFGRF